MRAAVVPSVNGEIGG